MLKWYREGVVALVGLLVVVGCGPTTANLRPTVMPATLVPSRLPAHTAVPALVAPKPSLTRVSQAPTPGWIEQAQAEGAVRTSVPTPTPVPPTSTPFPAAIQPPGNNNVTLGSDGDGYRVDLNTGAFGRIWWEAPARLHVEWLHDENIKQSFWSYRVEPDSGTIDLDHGAGYQIQASMAPNQTLSIRLLDASMGQWQTVFSLDPVIPQWTDLADRRWDFEDAGGTITTRWISDQLAVISATPGSMEYDQALAGWGKILLVDLKTRLVRVLAEQGQLMAVLPDRSLLMRHGWIDGAIQLIAPPYNTPPVTLAPGGPWVTDWILAPDGRRIAWLEWTAPTQGDWSRRLPHRCCSGDPPPNLSALAIWDRATQQLQHFPVSGIKWWMAADLRWNEQGSVLRFVINPDTESDRIAEFEIDLEGRQTLLASTEHGLGIQLIAVSKDRSRYMMISGYPGQNSVELIRRFPDGSEAVVRTIDDARTFRGNPWLTWSVSASGQVIDRYDDGTIIIEDLNSGKEIARALFPPEAELSPDYRWIAYKSGAVVHIRPLLQAMQAGGSPPSTPP